MEASETSEESNSEDWPTKASSTIVHYVGTVRDKTTGPALVASRYAVYLIAIALIGILTVIVGLISITRLLVISTGKLAFVDENDPWLAYLILGGICIFIGLFLWKLKEPRTEIDD